MSPTITKTLIANTRLQAETRHSETARGMFEALHSHLRLAPKLEEPRQYEDPVTQDKYETFLLGWYANQETGGW